MKLSIIFHKKAKGFEAIKVQIPLHILILVASLLPKYGGYYA